MQVMPPELVTSESAQGGAKKEFQSMELLPNKLESGTSEEVRLLGVFSSGHMLAPWRAAVEEKQPDGTLRFAGYDFSMSYEGFDGLARQTDWSTPDRKKIEGEFVKPKRALCAIIWSYERKQVELLVMEQKSLKDSLTEILNEGDDFSFDEDTLIANFVLKISKSGQGIDTNYSLLPKPRKIEAEVKKAFDAVRETAKVEKLLIGQHPIRQPRPEFSSTAGGDAEF